MIKKEPKKTDEKWIHYQDVKVLNIEVKPTEKTEKDIKEFLEFIKQEQNNNTQK